MHNKSSHASLAARPPGQGHLHTWRLRDAGLRIDGYKILRIDRPTKAQKPFLEAMQLLKK